MAANQPPNQPAGPLRGGEGPPLSPALRKQLQRCFERAHEVLRQDKPDHDYAHTMFAECVLKDPGNLEYTEALLDNLHKKYKNNKRGSRFSGFVSKSGFRKAIAEQDWDEIFALGIDLLRSNPWDVTVLRGLAEACRARHLNETELRYLKNALDVDRKNIEVNRHCAESLTRMGQFDQAIACWHRIEELDKGHTEARRKISELTIAKTRGLPGVDTSASSRPAGSPAPRPLTTGEPAPENPSAAARSPRTAAATPKSTEPPAPVAAPVEPTAPVPNATDALIGELQARVARDPTDLNAYLQLAEAQTEAGVLREAHQTLKRALEAAGGSDLAIQEKLEDAQVRMTRSQVAIAEQRAAADKSPEAVDLAKRFRSELNRQEMLILATRAERYPQDAGIRLELGLRLKREGNYREALKALEAAQAVPELQPQSSLEMGECYQHLKQYGLALQCYQASVAATAPPSELHCLALYRTGVLATALKHLEVAQECLSRLVQSAPDYRDAAARLDKVREIRDKD